jgi:hypothetical protein
MKMYLLILLLAGALFSWPFGAQAHCDAVDGPVAAAARKALDTKNVNLILPYAPAEAEPGNANSSKTEDSAPLEVKTPRTRSAFWLTPAIRARLQAHKASTSLPRMQRAGFHPGFSSANHYVIKMDSTGTVL